MNRSDPRWAVILTSYSTETERGNRLGVPGYSYDIVSRLLFPLLARWGEVIAVPRDPGRIEESIHAARRRGLEPIQLSVLPFQDVYLTSSAPNVVFPFWEFPDVPAELFDGNLQNNWVATANRCDLILVCGSFTAEALQRAGIRAPIRIVPVPTPAEYFNLPPWSPDTTTRLDCPAYVFPHPDVPAHELWDAPDTVCAKTQIANLPGQDRSRISDLKYAVCDFARRAYRIALKPLIPPIVHRKMRNRVRPAGADPWQEYLSRCRREELELSGIVYTSIFSPQDGRKNREDLISGFLAALHDCADATLVIKLAAADSMWIDGTLNYYRTAGLSHRCKVVFITDYLSSDQMLALAQASTYYLTTTRAEGCCLPLLNYLAAGRPGITPCHTAIGDYFTPDMGFIIASAAERAFWPQDKRIRFKTTWNRIEWPSVIEQLRASYDLARREPATYEALAATSRERMSGWVDPESVWPRLREALDLLAKRSSLRGQAA